MQRTPRSALQRRLDFALIALAVFTAAAVITALFLDSRPAQSASPGSYTVPSVEASEDTRPVALFIGDSYTNGTGAPKSKRWTSLVAKDMGWREVNHGMGGTGFVSTADTQGCGRGFCPAYSGNIEDSAEVAADFVIIAGGQNDFPEYSENPGEVRKAITATYEAARNAFPEARIVAVGPSTVGEVDELVLGMTTDVRAAADAVDATYVSLTSPDVIEDDMVLPDGGHVGPEGHAAIAERVTKTLS